MTFNYPFITLTRTDIPFGGDKASWFDLDRIGRWPKLIRKPLT